MDLLKPVADIARQRPGLWPDVEQALSEYHAESTQQYFLPAQTWMDLSETATGDTWRWPSIASVLGPWRYSQRVYRFDVDLYHQLTDRPNVSQLPIDVLTKLPDWSIYIDWSHVPNIPHDLRLYGGAWVRVGDDLGDADSSLQAVFHAPDGDLLVQQLPLIPGMTLTETVRMFAHSMHYSDAGGAHKQAVKNDVDAVIHGSMQLLGRLIPLALFLCTDEPDIEKLHVPTEQRLTKGRKKSGAMKVPKRPRICDVGEDFGRLVRRFEKEHKDAKDSGVTPHIRSAHWHTYLTGPKNSEQRRIMRWIPPLMIGVKDS